MSAWSVLPNAAHIDRVLESLKTHPEIWAAQSRPWIESRKMVQAAEAAHAVLLQSQTSQTATYDAIRKAVNIYSNPLLECLAAQCAVAALIAWDDSAQFLEMTGDKLEVWMRISDDPRAILLLPAVRVFERIKELKTL